MRAIGAAGHGNRPAQNPALPGVIPPFLHFIACPIAGNEISLQWRHFPFIRRNAIQENS